MIRRAPQDQGWETQLVQHLQVLVRTASIELWTTDRIRPGENHEQVTDVALKQADVAILLLSADFLASEFLQDVELPKLLQRSQLEGLKVIPVLIRSCLWQAHPGLSALKPLPAGGHPIASFQGDDRDRVLTEIAAEIAQSAGAFPASATVDLRFEIARFERFNTNVQMGDNYNDRVAIMADGTKIWVAMSGALSRPQSGDLEQYYCERMGNISAATLRRLILGNNDVRVDGEYVFYAGSGADRYPRLTFLIAEQPGQDRGLPTIVSSGPVSRTDEGPIAISSEAGMPNSTMQDGGHRPAVAMDPERRLVGEILFATWVPEAAVGYTLESLRSFGGESEYGFGGASSDVCSVSHEVIDFLHLKHLEHSVYVAVAVTRTEPADHCHASAPALSFVEFVETSKGWALGIVHANALHAGAWGDPPAQIRAMKIGHDTFAIVIEGGFTGQGYAMGYTSIYALLGSSLREVFTADTYGDDSATGRPHEDEWSTDIRTVERPTGLYDLVIHRHGLREGRAIDEKVLHRFDGRVYIPLGSYR